MSSLNNYELNQKPKLILIAKQLCRDLRKHGTDGEKSFGKILTPSISRRDAYGNDGEKTNK
jgi:hypothetical protein